MKRIITKVGDVFEVTFDDGTKGYLQYIVRDLTQLNSDVVRVFRERYGADEHPDLESVVTGEVDFYAHCVTKWGVKLGFWDRVANVPYVGKVDTLFRDSSDVGNHQVKKSEGWWVWKVNEEQVFVGSLEGAFRMAEIGVVINPASIVHRMKTGSYDFVYPDY